MKVWAITGAVALVLGAGLFLVGERMSRGHDTAEQQADAPDVAEGSLPRGLGYVAGGSLLFVGGGAVLMAMGVRVFFDKVRVVPSLPEAAQRGREIRTPGR